MLRGNFISLAIRISGDLMLHFGAMLCKNIELCGTVLMRLNREL